MKNKFILLSFALSICIYWMSGINAQASDGEEYITISIDATDDNSELMYSLDSDDPSAFTKSNEFVIPAGTSHTIYVKDAAGNITSQQYVPETSTTVVGSTANPDTADQNIDINLEVGGGSSGTGTTTSKYDYLTDSPAETGEGTVYDKIVTDSTIDSQKIFYDITTEEGDVFHLVVDQGNTANNVYLLKQVKNSDLQALAVDDTGAQKEQENEESLLQALAAEDAAEENLTENAETEDTKNNSILKILGLAAAGGGAFYYFKVYKKKKHTEIELSDAHDMDDFEVEDDEVDFEYDEREKEAFLEKLLEDDDYEGLDDFEDDEEIPFSQIEKESEIVEEEVGMMLPAKEDFIDAESNHNLTDKED